MKTGRIKWFNFSKGFGWIIPAEGRDVFLHSEIIPDKWRQYILPGTEIQYEDQPTPRGPAATRIKVNWRFETWYLPSPSSHKLAIKDHSDNTVAVFHTHDEMGEWIKQRRNIG